MTECGGALGSDLTADRAGHGRGKLAAAGRGIRSAPAGLPALDRAALRCERCKYLPGDPED